MQPLMRDAYEKNPDMTKDEAEELVKKCLLVLYYRDGRSHPSTKVTTSLENNRLTRTCTLCQYTVLWHENEFANYIFLV